MGEVVAEPSAWERTMRSRCLGVTALESVGIEVDPVNQRLKSCRQ